MAPEFGASYGTVAEMFPALQRLSPTERRLTSSPRRASSTAQARSCTQTRLQLALPVPLVKVATDGLITAVVYRRGNCGSVRLSEGDESSRVLKMGWSEAGVCSLLVCI